MTITIEIPDELSERLADAGVPAERTNKTVEYALTIMLDQIEIQAWWDSLTPEERQAERAAIDKNLKAAHAGKSVPAAEAFERIRTRYATGSAA